MIHRRAHYFGLIGDARNGHARGELAAGLIEGMVDLVPEVRDVVPGLHLDGQHHRSLAVETNGGIVV